MKVYQQIILVLPAAAAFSNSAVSRKAFVARQAQLSVAVASPSTSTVLMDTEGDAIDFASRQKIEALLDQVSSSLQGTKVTVEDAKTTHGMPWTHSIDEELGDDALLYMPFWDWQMDFMEKSLTNLRAQPCVSDDVDFTYNDNEKKKARIVNACFSSDEYRKIRMTYYDAGDKTQVFNSVWYPNPKYNLPVLGIDILAFNRKKYLAIVDFQPLHKDEQDHATTFEDKLKPIKENYDALKGRMSSKFYDETQFFSQQMLFARFEDEGVVDEELLPAFKEYVEAHLNLVKETTPEPAEVQFVMSRQQAYDTYSADRDPATGLFAAMFGNEWADGFVHDFLFSLSEKTEGGPAPRAGPPMGGPPQQSQPQQEKQLAETPTTEAQRA